MNNESTNNNKKDLKPLNRVFYQAKDEIKELVREVIIPELIEAIKDHRNHSFRDGLEEALGIAKLKTKSHTHLNFPGTC